MNSRQRRREEAMIHQQKREEQAEAIRQYKLKRRQPKTKEEIRTLAIVHSLAAMALTFNQEIRKLSK